MAPPARRPAESNPRFLHLALALAGAGCGDQEPGIPNVTIEMGSPALRDHNGVLLRDGAPFSGFVVETDGPRLRAKTPYLRGLRHGRARAYYPDGNLAWVKVYRDGNREGTHSGWWQNGTAQFVYHYQNDLFEGEQVGYYKNGVRSELRHYRAGHEDGRQSTWDGDGRLAANYTFKNGRRYGIVGRFDCVSVHEK